MIERCKTGIRKLDDILSGGIPRKNLVAIAGPSGSGKTNLSIQLLYNGVVKYNEPGIYLAAEQTLEEILNASHQIGCDLTSIVKSGLVSVLPVSRYDLERTFFSIETESLRKPNAGNVRVVIDPVFLSEEDKGRIPFFKKLLRDINCTTFFTVEKMPGRVEGMSYADGIIELDSLSTRRNIRVGKMRGTSHDLGRFEMGITSKGIVIGPRLSQLESEIAVEA